MHSYLTVYTGGGFDFSRQDLSGAAVLMSNHLSLRFRQAVNRPSSLQFNRQKKRSFEKGNYSRYYGYRLADGESEDSRLNVSFITYQTQFIVTIAAKHFTPQEKDRPSSWNLDVQGHTKPMFLHSDSYDA